MTKRILYCATVDYHFKAFHLPYMKWFKEQGWNVDVVANGDIDLPYTDDKYNVPISRSPFSSSNVRAYKQLKEIIDQNNYSIIHCHTPLGGVLARFASRQVRRKGTKVIYTAHGFHFCKGVPIQNWLIYYPIEKHLSRFTDSLITINAEDYNLARSHRFKANRIYQVSGVGIDIEKFKRIDSYQKKELKKSLGYQPDDFLLFNASEFNKNKNQQFLIRAITLIKQDVPNIKLLLAGEGPMLEKCKKLANQLEVSHHVDFLGFRSDIDQLAPMCDLAVASSFREGLPVNIMEAMSCELPVVAVDNRGHRELIQNNKTGWLIKRFNLVDFSNKVKDLIHMGSLRNQLGVNGRNVIINQYSINKVLSEKIRIYQTVMKERGERLWMAH